MAAEICVGGVKYQLAGTSEDGNIYVIQQQHTPEPETQQSTVQTNSGEYVINDIGEIGEEAIVMFEESGVGAEEVVSSNDYELCFVDTGTGGDPLAAGSSSSYQPLILSNDMGVVEEEVTTEIIKTEITTDEHSQQFFIKNEAVEYEDGVDMKKVFVTKSNFEQPLNLVKKEKKGSKLSIYTVDPQFQSEQDRLTCSDCGKLFTSKRSMVGHKKEKHSGTIEIFPCVHCGKNFSRKSNLKAHMDSIHFGKKFPCAYCERIFTNRSCMNLHVKKAHTETVTF